MKSKVLYISNGKINDEQLGNSGIDITYIKSKKKFRIGGWYDSCVGIQSTEIDLAYLMDYFGIKK